MIKQEQTFLCGAEDVLRFAMRFLDANREHQADAKQHHGDDTDADHHIVHLVCQRQHRVGRTVVDADKDRAAHAVVEFDRQVSRHVQAAEQGDRP